MNQYDLNILVICAFRYALGRRTYITQTMATLIIKYKDQLCPHNVGLITKEIKEAIKSNHAGMDCDVAEWEALCRELNND